MLLFIFSSLIMILLCNSSLTFKPIPKDKLPEYLDLPIIQGKSASKSYIFLSPKRNKTQEVTQHSFIIDQNADILWYREGRFEHAKIHKNKHGEIRYCFGIHKITGNNYDLYIHNDKMEVIDIVNVIEHEDIYGYAPFSHDYLYIDDGHYVLLIYLVMGELRHFAIQEIHNGVLVFHWQSNYVEEQLTRLTFIEGFDYSHANSIDIDPSDGNFVVSCRNLGFFKLDKVTGKIKWVIGRNSEDFNIPIEHRPRFQHNVQVAYDGSYIAYDDSGYSFDFARVVRYWLDENERKLIKYKEYIYHQPRVEIFGGVEIIDDEEDILGITYGDLMERNMTFYMDKNAYEEYDFKNNRSVFSIRFTSGSSLYRISRLLK